jgi:hypothetical protein
VLHSDDRIGPQTLSLNAEQLKELSLALADRLYIQVAGWHLYLGDAGLADSLATECAARLDQGAGVCGRQALEAIQVPIGGGAGQLPLARLIPPGLLRDLEDVLEPFCG